VVVEVVAVGVLPYANEVFSGERKYLLTLPVVPGTGAVGRICSTSCEPNTFKTAAFIRPSWRQTRTPVT